MRVRREARTRHKIGCAYQAAYTSAGVRGSVWWCGAAGQAVAQAKAGRLEPFDRGLPGASLPRCGGCAVWLRRDGSMLRVSDSSEAFAIR